ncbi:coiled-coil domain-containing protein [Lacrimispora aerotolerans]|uniref:hypothetical protein n=1 Tax=Lacrimispora aerotolerans TaxID=36832 RepID=UPI00047E56A4|nr:hypothetical protein [Lacrimispora aerotolerans]
MNYDQMNGYGQESGGGEQMGGMLPNIQTELTAKLQSTVVGGYSKKSVEEYAVDMRKNLVVIKNQLEQQIRELTAEKVSVAQECQVLREQLSTAEGKLSSAFAQKEAAEQKARISAAKIKEWESRCSGYEEMKRQKAQYEEEISQKEQDINRLNEKLLSYQQAYEELQKKIRNMELTVQMPIKGVSSIETEELIQQKILAEQKYENLLVKVKELEAECAVQREAGEAYDKMEEKEKQAVAEERKAWENRMEVLQKQQEEQEGSRKELEEKFDVLYQNYVDSSDKIKSQERMLAEKELLLHHYQEQEQGAILTRQENETLKDTIDSLKETVRQIIEQMESQTESMNLYIERTTQERDTLKKVIGEQASLKLQNVELLDIQRGLMNQIEGLKLQNQFLEKGLDQQKKISLIEEREKRVLTPEKQPVVDGDLEPDEADVLTCDMAMQKARGLFSVMEGERAGKADEVKYIG